MKIPARLVFILAFAILFALPFLAKPAFAQSVTPNPLNTAPDVEKNLHNVTQVVMLETMSGVLCQLTGNDVLHPNQKCLGVDSKSGQIGFVGNGGGMIGAMGTMISYTMTPPVSSGQYISYLKNNFGLIKHTYAAGNDPPVCDIKNQGVGFCGLWPVENLWIGMRNIVYLIFILIFVIVGLGIMLRLHIDPRTVMTVQNQLPKVIIGIVAITFSFAIAGFLIDIMYVATYLFGNVIASAANGSTVFNDVIQAPNPFDAANTAAGGGGVAHLAGVSSDAFASLIKDTLTGVSNNFGGIPFFGDIIKGIINILALLIIAIAILIALIRLWVTLILSYLNIILDVVFAPFWILAGVVPESPMGLGTWLRDLLANLAVFPMTVSFFLLANVFMNAFQGGNKIDRFVPPLLGGVNSTTISALIGLGFILMLPNMLTTMKAALKAPKLDFGSIFGPVRSGGAAVANIPKRSLEMAERTRFAKGKGGKDKLFALFGNPLYEPRLHFTGGGEHSEGTGFQPSHTPGVPGGKQEPNS